MYAANGNGKTKVKASSSKTLIVGLGKTGLSCARYLASQGITVAVTDSRPQPPGLVKLREEMPDTALFLGGFDRGVFSAAERLVVSPGVSLREPLIQAAVARGIPVVGDIELFAQAVKAPVIAITGSNGKSTVTSLVAEMAKQAGGNVAVGGNLGQPALDLLDDEITVYVLELSSFQLETTHRLETVASVVLNLSPDHLDRYSTLEDYAAAKARIYSAAATAIVNRDDPAVVAMTPNCERQIGFTLDKPSADDYGLCIHQDASWLCRGDKPLLPASALRLPGRHNLANALAALALGDAAGIPLAAMLDALRHFNGLPHRTQFVAEKKKVYWYNDSKGTNPGATIAALRGMHDAQTASRTVLIAGGDGKGADFAQLAAIVRDTVRAVILIGKDASLLEKAFGNSVPIEHAGDMKQAVKLANKAAQPGDRVLLSPACASFDMYANFEERGQHFMDEIGSLPS